MFKINSDKSIYLTRGDIANITILGATEDGDTQSFKAGDVLRLRVFKKKDCQCVVIQKDVTLETDSVEATISLKSEDTKIGEIINKPVDYWYEVELNPDTEPQTIIGYDEEGSKVFKLFPEGSDIE